MTIFVVQSNHFFYNIALKSFVEPTISHTTMCFRRIRRPSGLGRQLKFRFSRPRSQADEPAAVVGPPIPLLLNTGRLYIPVQAHPKILKYVANMLRRAARRTYVFFTSLLWQKYDFLHVNNIYFCSL